MTRKTRAELLAAPLERLAVEHTRAPPDQIPEQRERRSLREGVGAADEHLRRRGVARDALQQLAQES